MKGAGESLTPFVMLLRFFSSYRVALSSLGVKAFALSSCVLLCHALLSSLGGLLFSGRKHRVSGSGGEVR